MKWILLVWIGCAGELCDVSDSRELARYETKRDCWDAALVDAMDAHTSQLGKSEEDFIQMKWVCEEII